MVTTSGPDQAVVASAYATARGLGASNKVMLALFEAGLVESGFRNLPAGDRDSVGFLQQRPSKGWGTVEQCMNVPHATTAFVNDAKGKEGSAVTSGQLAQAVQRSAFPLRYDAVRGPAQELLNNAQLGQPAVSQSAQSVQGFGGNPLSSIADFAGFITNADNWRRVGLFIAGFVLVTMALAKMTGAASVAGKAVKLGAKAAAL